MTGESDMERVECRSSFLNLPECQRFLIRSKKAAHKKEYCSTLCKNAYHKAAREMGTAAIEAMKGRL